MLCPGGFNTCNVLLADRERFRKNNTDVCLATGNPLYQTDLLIPAAFRT